ncbi:hypothetical protein B5V00_07105 [Geothermobacter hydrogeniphilus]|uniref:DJ-1/PfpI domain-containing protein n=1 Tax=Geothermobacter hydrogeniphilus TaxID=1969733 RepID=A0A1X0Y635_9BACT|nr:hypothetical protein B5V00_07105 [Geothermobacter hydrogeniphilus]
MESNEVKCVRKKVLLFLGEGFEDLEAVSVLSVCGWTEYREHLSKVEVVITGLHPVVNGRFGLQIKTDLLVTEVKAQDYAALAVPGGFRLMRPTASHCTIWPGPSMHMVEPEPPCASACCLLQKPGCCKEKKQPATLSAVTMTT